MNTLLVLMGALLASRAPSVNPVTSRTLSPAARSTRSEAPRPELRAKYLITTADDFIVDVYHNGQLVPDAKRTLLEERFGATVERIDVEVRRGDWVVFNVVNNRLRWGGNYYFGAAGCLGPNQFGFVSRLDSGRWSVCDRLEDVERFIAEKDHLSDQAAQVVQKPWEEGDLWMRRLAGEHWSGVPLWGHTRNTWIKVAVD
jgi:hypothetical protein